jgi:DNA-binding NarL/FixJ family response regulator
MPCVPVSRRFKVFMRQCFRFRSKANRSVNQGTPRYRYGLPAFRSRSTEIVGAKNSVDIPETATKPSRITLLLADDHKIVRQGLRSLLDKLDGFECIGEVDDGFEAVKLAEKLQPDIVIMEALLPRVSGIAATQELKSVLPNTKVVILSALAPATSVMRALQAGASAYVLKDSGFEELNLALTTVSKGSIYLSPSITRPAEFRNRSDRRLSGELPLGGNLTDRELQVLCLIADGASTKEIAARLTVSVKTVETHRKQIMDKLGIRNIAGLTKYCIREGLTSI